MGKGQSCDKRCQQKRWNENKKRDLMALLQSYYNNNYNKSLSNFIKEYNPNNLTTIINERKEDNKNIFDEKIIKPFDKIKEKIDDINKSITLKENSYKVDENNITSYKNRINELEKAVSNLETIKTTINNIFKEIENLYNEVPKMNDPASLDDTRNLTTSNTYLKAKKVFDNITDLDFNRIKGSVKNYKDTIDEYITEINTLKLKVNDEFNNIKNKYNDYSNNLNKQIISIDEKYKTYERDYNHKLNIIEVYHNNCETNYNNVVSLRYCTNSEDYGCVQHIYNKLFNFVENLKNDSNELKTYMTEINKSLNDFKPSDNMKNDANYINNPDNIIYNHIDEIKKYLSDIDNNFKYIDKDLEMFLNSTITTSYIYEYTTALKDLNDYYNEISTDKISQIIVKTQQLFNKIYDDKGNLIITTTSDDEFINKQLDILNNTLNGNLIDYENKVDDIINNKKEKFKSQYQYKNQYQQYNEDYKKYFNFEAIKEIMSDNNKTNSQKAEILFIICNLMNQTISEYDNNIKSINDIQQILKSCLLSNGETNNEINGYITKIFDKIKDIQNNTNIIESAGIELNSAAALLDTMRVKPSNINNVSDKERNEYTITLNKLKNNEITTKNKVDLIKEMTTYINNIKSNKTNANNEDINEFIKICNNFLISEQYNNKQSEHFDENITSEQQISELKNMMIKYQQAAANIKRNNNKIQYIESLINIVNDREQKKKTIMSDYINKLNIIYYKLVGYSEELKALIDAKGGMTKSKITKDRVLFSLLVPGMVPYGWLLHKKDEKIIKLIDSHNKIYVPLYKEFQENLKKLLLISLNQPINETTLNNIGVNDDDPFNLIYNNVSVRVIPSFSTMKQTWNVTDSFKSLKVYRPWGDQIDIYLFDSINMPSIYILNNDNTNNKTNNNNINIKNIVDSLNSSLIDDKLFEETFYKDISLSSPFWMITQNILTQLKNYKKELYNKINEDTNIILISSETVERDIKNIHLKENNNLTNIRNNIEYLEILLKESDERIKELEAIKKMNEETIKLLETQLDKLSAKKKKIYEQLMIEKEKLLSIKRERDKAEELYNKSVKQETDFINKSNEWNTKMTNYEVRINELKELIKQVKNNMITIENDNEISISEKENKLLIEQVKISIYEEEMKEKQKQYEEAQRIKLMYDKKAAEQKQQSSQYLKQLQNLNKQYQYQQYKVGDLGKQYQYITQDEAETKAAIKEAKRKQQEIIDEINKEREYNEQLRDKIKELEELETKMIKEIKGWRTGLIVCAVVIFACVIGILLTFFIKKEDYNFNDNTRKIPILIFSILGGLSSAMLVACGVMYKVRLGKETTL